MLEPQLLEHPVIRQIHTNLVMVGTYAEFLPETETAAKRLQELESQERISGKVIPLLLEEKTHYQVNEYYNIHDFSTPTIRNIFETHLYDSHFFAEHYKHIISGLIKAPEDCNSFCQLITVNLTGRHPIPNAGEFMFEGFGKPFKIKWYINRQSPIRTYSIPAFHIDLVIEFCLEYSTNAMANHMGYELKVDTPASESIQDMVRKLGVTGGMRIKKPANDETLL